MTGYHRRDGELVTDKRGGVFHQAFASKHGFDPRRHTQAFQDRFGRDRIGRRDNRA